MHLLIKERQLWKVEARFQSSNTQFIWRCNFKKTLTFCTLIFWKVLLNNPYYLESMDLVHSREAFSPQGELWALFAISIMRKRPAPQRDLHCPLPNWVYYCVHSVSKEVQLPAVTLLPATKEYILNSHGITFSPNSEHPITHVGIWDECITLILIMFVL